MWVKEQQWHAEEKQLGEIVGDMLGKLLDFSFVLFSWYTISWDI